MKYRLQNTVKYICTKGYNKYINNNKLNMNKHN